jgi:hypothetical protein
VFVCVPGRDGEDLQIKVIRMRRIEEIMSSWFVVKVMVVVVHVMVEVCLLRINGEVVRLGTSSRIEAIQGKGIARSINTMAA